MGSFWLKFDTNCVMCDMRIHKRMISVIIIFYKWINPLIKRKTLIKQNKEEEELININVTTLVDVAKAILVMLLCIHI